MQMKLCVTVAMLALSLGGCATKRYGRMQPLSGAERSAYSCRELGIEMAKIEAFDDAIKQGSQADARSALGFLADFGIGNSMEKGDAERSASMRKSQISAAQAEKGCSASVASSDRRAVDQQVTGQADTPSDVRLIPARTASGFCVMAPANYVGTGSATRPAITSAQPRCAAGM
jgi:hypothetical protein